MNSMVVSARGNPVLPLGGLLIVSFLLVLPYKHLFELPMLLMSMLGLGMLVMQPRRVWAMPGLQVMLMLGACFWLPMLTSFPTAVNFQRSAETAGIFLRFPLAGIFVLTLLQHYLIRQWLLGLIGMWLSVIALCMVFQSLHVVLPGGVGSAVSVLASQRGIGFLLATLSPVYVYWLARHRHQSVWLMLPVYLAAILLTGRRAAWVMLGVGLGLVLLQMLWAERRHWQWKPVIAVLVLIGIGSFTAMQQPEFRARVMLTGGLFSGNYVQANSATSLRLPIWKTATKVFCDHWLTGIGPRGFRYVYPQYGDKDDPFLAANPKEGPTHPHQFMLEIATETGVIGLLGYLIALGYWIRLMLQAAKEKNNQVLPWMMAVLIAIMPLNAHMAFYASFWSCITWWLVMICLAFWQAPKMENVA